MREQNYLRADSLVVKLGHGDIGRKHMALLQAFKIGNRAEAKRLSEEYVARPDGLITVSLDVAVMDPFAGEELAVEMHKHRKAGAQRNASFKSMAVLDVEQGQLRSAVARLDSAGSDGLGFKATIAMLPVLEPSRAALLEIYDDVLRSDSSVAPSATAPIAVLAPQFRLYHLAMLSCRLGEPQRALEFARRLESVPVAPYWKESMSALATNVRAQVNIVNGDARQALARIESIKTDAPFDLFYTPAMRLAELLWHAELLFLNGRHDDALAWFENVDDAVITQLPVLTYTMLRRAQIHERKGDDRDAIELYSRVLKNWSSADAELQPLVLQTRDALARLQKRVG